ncbi:MAG: AsmA-like C-terminal region-containing protein, partial [Luteimonas sp.]
YGNGGFVADKLAVLHAGLPGVMSLRVGTYVHDPLQAFEGDLDASLTADNLLQRAPQLEWLKPYLTGRSTWTVAIAIPKGTGAATTVPTRLQLRSNLVGTTLNLPMPIHKAASMALPATIDTALPMGSGETRIALGNMLGLRARSDDRNTGVRVVLGTSNVTDPPPAVGLIASGHATTLDALGWIALVNAAFVKPTTSNSGKNTGSSPMPLRSIDLTADRLMLFNSGFPNIRVQVTPAAGGTAVQVSGDALTGMVRVPDADGAAIAGQFQHVHWRSAPTDATPGVTNTANTSPTNGINPVSIPPLIFDVADLRFNDANLGSARLRTRRTADGLHVDQLQTQSPAQQISITGDWTGHASTARTRLAITLDSSDFGALLDGFGYAGQLAGGHGKATFNATWPGDPSGLRMGTVTGTLSLAARNGQLVTLDPGAGRVLGLLSLAQLPRRLSLDFHDFFSKGFAFNSIDGDIHIGAGLARSDNLVIDGPAAEIRIRGAANLMAQQFDQTVEVLPKAGNLLTAVGAIAGGPIGAAIGAAANAVLKKPLGRLAAKTYRVTGPWKQPKVETISREQSRINTTSPPPSG